ncbi:MULTISPECIES: AraC family transcriptional regulator [unclassified Nonomuraea]|uniref:AraC family transcriptional regulator n=1 Tax=unclassified Nonomuraea TaxID=2593643 RepID=UPI00191BFD13|nr:AraC family transcriptional regulator [Nonomuraea sp. KC401]
MGHYDKLPGYATRRPIGSPSWLLVWTEAGEGLVEQGGTSFTMGAGDLAVLAAGVAQHYRVRTGARRWRFWWVHFQPRPGWAAWLAPYAEGDGCHRVAGVPPSVHGRIGQAFQRALQDARWAPGLTPPSLAEAPAPGRGMTRDAAPGGVPAGVPGEVWVPALAVGGPARELVLGAVEEVLVLATASARPEGTRTGEEGDARVRRALAIIEAEPGAPHSVASLARAVALSPSRFAHLFAEATGQTPMRVVRRARAVHAASLLEVTDLDVGQVAEACGFVSPFHFSRTFSKEYGMPPRDYRARLRDRGPAQTSTGPPLRQ